jgi:hypothetical protein
LIHVVEFSYTKIADSDVQWRKVMQRQASCTPLPVASQIQRRAIAAYARKCRSIRVIADSDAEPATRRRALIDVWPVYMRLDAGNELQPAAHVVVPVQEEPSRAMSPINDTSVD